MARAAKSTTATKPTAMARKPGRPHRWVQREREAR